MKMDYFEAMALAREGKRVQRTAWRSANPGIFVFQRPATQLPSEFIPSMNSLPETTKQALIKKEEPIFFSNYMCLFNGKTHVMNNWQPSELDRRSNDWVSLDE